MEQYVKKAYLQPDVIVNLLDREDILTDSPQGSDYMATPDWGADFWGGNK